MLEMASLGAKVMQPVSIQDARLNRIAIEVKSSFVKKPGTLITKRSNIINNKIITGIFDLLVISVPGFFTNDDLTSIAILFNLASCIETGCITLAPSEAISNISSYEITLIFFALFSLFGSVV
jgi:aspartokinase